MHIGRSNRFIATDEVVRLLAVPFVPLTRADISCHPPRSRNRPRHRETRVGEAIHAFWMTSLAFAIALTLPRPSCSAATRRIAELRTGRIGAEGVIRPVPFLAYLKSIGCKCDACEKRRRKKRAEARAEKLRMKQKAERKAQKAAEKLAGGKGGPKKKPTKAGLLEAQAKANGKPANGRQLNGKHRPVDKNYAKSNSLGLGSAASKAALTILDTQGVGSI